MIVMTMAISPVPALARNAANGAAKKKWISDNDESHDSGWDTAEGEVHPVHIVVAGSSKEVKVPDRSAVVTANAETQVVKPLGLQELINAEIAKYPHGRCFIRPSSTEDILRVYAEASTQEAADTLAQSVEQHVKRILACGNTKK